MNWKFSVILSYDDYRTIGKQEQYKKNPPKKVNKKIAKYLWPGPSMSGQLVGVQYSETAP